MIQTEIDFTAYHGAENNRGSEMIYEDNMIRLSGNAKVLLQAMLRGRMLTGLDCSRFGILHEGKMVFMTEYRKRFSEIEKALWDNYKVILQKHTNKPSGAKTWYLLQSDIDKIKTSLR